MTLTFTDEEKELLIKEGFEIEGLVAEDVMGYTITKNKMGKYNYCGEHGGGKQYYETLEEALGLDADWESEDKYDDEDLPDEKCICKSCGYEWNPYATEHFNISFCISCNGTNIKF